MRPNSHHAWDCFDDSPINADAHAEALDVLEAWKFAPWKGAIHQGKVFIEETTYRGHWEELASQPTPRPAETRPASCSPESDLSLSSRITKVSLNQVHEEYLQSPVTELANLRVAIAAYASQGKHISQAVGLLAQAGADIYIEVGDIISEFVLDLFRRFDKGQYQKAEYPLHSWIAFIWSAYFFPGVQTKVLTYLKLTTFMNQLDKDDPDYKHENHAVLMSSVELEMAKREAEGYRVPLSLDRILRDLGEPQSPLCKLSPVVKSMVLAMAKGATKTEAAEHIGISDRHARRLFESVIAEVSR